MIKHHSTCKSFNFKGVRLVMKSHNQLGLGRRDTLPTHIKVTPYNEFLEKHECADCGASELREKDEQFANND